MELKGRCYVRTTKAWYWESAVKNTAHEWIDEVYFYSDDPHGEMAMRWYYLRDEAHSPRLEVFIESAAAKWDKTVKWKTSTIQMLAAMFSAEIVLAVDDREENLLELMKQHPGGYILKTAISLS